MAEHPLDTQPDWIKLADGVTWDQFLEIEGKDFTVCVDGVYFPALAYAEHLQRVATVEVGTLMWNPYQGQWSPVVEIQRDDTIFWDGDDVLARVTGYSFFLEDGYTVCDFEEDHDDRAGLMGVRRGL